MSVKITILGAGPGGYVAAVRAAQKGAEVTLIERAQPGGTCLNRGCIPSKIMRTAADLLVKVGKSREFGVTITGDIGMDMAKLQARKQKVLQTQIKALEGLFAKHGIKHIKGEGTITEAGKTAVKQADGSNIEVGWDKLIIATGAKPLIPSGIAVDGKTVITSDEALNLTTAPKSVVIVGGGVIGCEFASILNAYGAQVTIVEGMDRLLPVPGVDEECSKTLQREMKKQKITFIVNRTVNAVTQRGGKAKVAIGPSPWAKNLTENDKKKLDIETDLVLLSIGRSPATEGLGLETLNIATDKKGWVKADDAMRTSQPDVFAIGDILGPDRIMLAHVASSEGMVAAGNALGGNRKMDYSAVPSAIFTMPEIGCVGLTEKGANDRGLKVRSESVLFRVIGKAQVMDEIGGQAKIVFQEDTGRIVGVHIIGPHATDLIAEGVLAVKTGTTVKELAETIHAHPTLAEVMAETAHKAIGLPIHG